MKRLTMLAAGLALVLASSTAMAQPYRYGMMEGNGYGLSMMYGSREGYGYGPSMMHSYRHNYRYSNRHHGRAYYDYGYGMMGPGWYGGDHR